MVEKQDNTGIYALCSNIWDEEKQQYVNRDVVDIQKCCIERCNVPVDFCHKTCTDMYGVNGKKPSGYWEFRCNETCNDQHIVCQDGCEAGSTWRKNNPFIECSKEFGCVDGVKSKSECVKKHKDELLNCCYDKCVDGNCERLCQYAYELSSEQKHMQNFLQKVKYAPAKIVYENQGIKYVVLGLIISIIVFVGVYIVYRYMSRDKQITGKDLASIL